MRLILAALLWCILFAVCWPLALLFLFAWPVLLLLSIPFRIFGLILSACFAFFAALLFLPSRILGYRRAAY